jgi:hypothetical protein
MKKFDKPVKENNRFEMLVSKISADKIMTDREMMYIKGGEGDILLPPPPPTKI